MIDSRPAGYRDYLIRREEVFNDAISAGDVEPFVYPFDTLAAGILLLAVLFIPSRRGVSRSSIWVQRGAFGMIVTCCVSVMLRCRSLGMASGYGIGLMSVWTIVWSAVLLLYNDHILLSKRVEWRDAKEAKREGWMTGECSHHSNGSVDVVRVPKASKVNRRVYGVVGGAHEPAETQEISQNNTRCSRFILVWQSYPVAFRHRLDWVVDLCTSFRGPGWDWHVQTLPKAEYPSERSMFTTPSSARRLLARIALRDFLFFYLLIDVLKTALMADPYFWGAVPITSSVPAPAFLPEMILHHQPLLRMYRLCLSMVAIFCALCYIFSLCPLVFAVIFPLLNLDRFTRTPLREPFLYPPYWGDFTKSVLDKGLAGWWGSWWHQMFRVGMSEPSRVAVKKLGWDPKSQRAKMLQLVIAFGVSGCVHAGGSYTTFSPAARPFSGPFVFFLFQACGIVAEQLVFKTMGLSSMMRNWPQLLKRAGTLCYILAWAYLTGPWLADDFARCGIWLFEPVPISVIRGIGLGARGEGWWCWHGTWFGWWRGIEGTPWWRKGFAIL